MSGFRTSKRARLEKEESKNEGREEGEGWLNFFQGRGETMCSSFSNFWVFIEIGFERKMNFP